MAYIDPRVSNVRAEASAVQGDRGVDRPAPDHGAERPLEAEPTPSPDPSPVPDPKPAADPQGPLPVPGVTPPRPTSA